MSRRTLTRGLVWGAATVALGVLVWAVPATVDFALHAPVTFWPLVLGALLVDLPLFGVSQPHDIRVRSTLSVCFTFAIFVLWGAAQAIVVQAVAAALTAVGQRYHPASSVYLVSRLVLAAAGAELVVDLVAPRPITRPGTGLNGGDILAFLLLAAVWLLVNYGLLTLARAMVSPMGVRQAVAEVRSDLLGTAVAVLVVSPLLTTIGGWATLLVAAPLFVWNQLSREQIRQQQRSAREPVSGMLNQRGLAVGLQALTALDLVQPAGPRSFGVVLINVESVLAINRRLGRDLYERVVIAASRRLVDLYGEDRVGRLSGESIAILIPDMTEADAVPRAREVVAALASRIDVDNVPFALDPFAGVALSPQHGRDLGTLLAKAELAATEARRNNVPAMLYIREAADVVERRLTLVRDLRDVLLEPARHGEITVLFQPKVELGSGRVAGVEALVRWTHPVWGPIPTDELIEAIEPTDVMHMLTLHMLATVADQVRRWNEQGRRLRVAVNISVQDLHVPDFVDELADLVRGRGIQPAQLMVELTERMVITDAPRIAEACGMLERFGIGLSLDDFGTGYASLQQLRQLPLTEVKIDRSYVRGFIDNPTDRAIVASVHALARALGVGVVAEGVEDRRTARALARLPGTVGQGYYFGKPMDADALRTWLGQVSLEPVS